MSRLRRGGSTGMARHHGGSTEQQLGFTPGSLVQVRQVDEKKWVTLRPLVYRASEVTFEVPAGAETDFASVPRCFVWLVPRYGSYTLAAILHDYLVEMSRTTGRISRVDADGVFRQALRTLGVGFLRRWFMWGAVRLAALTEPDGRRDWLRHSWQVLPLLLVAVPVVGPAALVITVSLLVFYLVEYAFAMVLYLVGMAKQRTGKPSKRVNRPTMSMRL
jgi:hypothetical protein